MAIDRQKEKMIRLSEACALFATRPEYSTVTTWAKKGYRGIILETEREGQSMVTSVEAVGRFIKSMTQEFG